MIYLDKYIQHNSKTIASYLSTVEDSLDAVDTLKDVDKMFHLQQVPNEKDNISLLQYIVDKRLTRQADQLMDVLIRINRSPTKINEIPVGNFGEKLNLVLEKMSQYPFQSKKILSTQCTKATITYIIIVIIVIYPHIWIFLQALPNNTNISSITKWGLDD